MVTTGQMDTASTAILSFPGYRKQAQALAEQLRLPCLDIRIHTFPDGESKITLPTELPPHLILLRSLDHPNSKLLELLLVADATRERGVNSLSLAAPYLCYMRQDMAFVPGEIISQKIIGTLLAQHFDNVISVDAHLHRIHHLHEAVPAKHAINLSATELLGEFLLQQTIKQPMLLGPDVESTQWVKQIAEIGQFDYAIAEKQRHGDRDVNVRLPQMDFTQRNIVIVDDVISSGHTVAAATTQLLRQGAASVHCLITHALFAPEAPELLIQAGVENIWSSDSIVHPSNVVSLAPLLAQALRTLMTS